MADAEKKPFPKDAMNNPAANLAQILSDESVEVARLCQNRNAESDLAVGKNTDGVPHRLGVAFSGGGIRSASVNLGIIQGLAKHGILRQVHYLSGISGGGYILGWLTSWIRRSGFKTVETELKTKRASDGASEGAPQLQGNEYARFLEPHPIRHLRAYTSYLTPRMGLGSGDTLAMISIYLRNVLLNQTLIVSVAACLLALAQLLAPWIAWRGPLGLGWQIAILAIGVAAGITAGVLSGTSLHRLGTDQQPRYEWKIAGRISGLAALVVAACLWLILPTTFTDQFFAHPWVQSEQHPVLAGALLAGFFMFVMYFSGFLKDTFSKGSEALEPVDESKWKLLFAALTAVLVAVGFLSAVTFCFEKWLNHEGQVYVGDWYVMLGLPAIMVAMALASYVHIGIFGKALPDAKREWLGRLAGYYLFYAAIAAVILIGALRGALWIHLLFRSISAYTGAGAWLKWILPGGWLFTVISGLLAAKSSSTGKGGKNRGLDILAKAAPPVFLAGVLLLVSTGVYWVATYFGAPAYLSWVEEDQGASPSIMVKTSGDTTLVYSGPGQNLPPKRTTVFELRACAWEVPLKLFFRNGANISVRNYTIVDNTLWNGDEHPAKTIPSSELQGDKTRSANNAEHVSNCIPHASAGSLRSYLKSLPSDTSEPITPPSNAKLCDAVGSDSQGCKSPTPKLPKPSNQRMAPECPPSIWCLVSKLLSVIGVALGIAILLMLRLDVNEFSMHLFYRNRLVRAFLGASNVKSKDNPKGRRPSPFTGFAVDDDVPLQELCSWWKRRRPCTEVAKPEESPCTDCYDGPYPIWGTALNLTSGEELAWQKRKAASFIYSPLYSGWDYVGNEPLAMERPQKDENCKDDLCQFAYRGTGKFTTTGTCERTPYTGHGCGPSIGTAMAASGAAISPNWGYHTSPAVATLLAIFNVRIGWWTGNPRRQDYWDNYAPGSYYLTAELLGATNDSGRYVYLSDGGHFENLGIYELVRRRVKYIIACDADADPTYDFSDLANAVEKCRRDFGVEIDIDASAIRPAKSADASTVQQFSDSHFAIGEIKYPKLNDSDKQAFTGLLVYIKSSLTGNESADVLGQRPADSDFPHDTTVNQFFNETQFEVYRALGEHMFDSIWRYHAEKATNERPLVKIEEKAIEGLNDFFNRLKEYKAEHSQKINHNQAG